MTILKHNETVAIVQIGNDNGLLEKIQKEQEYYMALGYKTDLYYFDGLLIQEIIDEIKELAKYYDVVIAAEPLPHGLRADLLKRELFASGLKAYVKMF